ncbi:mesoderm induction early response protein 1-like isoform X2 [Diadema setosum]|uniref:mesoderm induction early response protein 1-like isoform X2 n=1 Tax=Diadema setosum TaxID=31175 RepID=UPI003B3AB1FE
MAEPATSDSSPENDRDFDVTAEMMVHDYDDERTLEEEEQNESGESFSNNELDELAQCISVGHDFQAIVPEGLSPYDDAPVYENEDRLLWDPNKLQAADVERFLDHVHQPLPGVQGLKALPTGCHIRDDERALYILLQCGHNVEEALRRHRMQMAPPADEMSLWSEEECRNFESGLRTYGKNFHLIHQHKVRTRSVGELVQFYYLWKKTARHDMFANQSRLVKKKYHLHPGITDYMDRFLDDMDNSMSPPPAQSLLDRSRINKPPNQVTMLALNGVPDLQNCSPELGVLASGDLPSEASASVNYASTRTLPITSEDGVPPTKKQKLKESNDLLVLENLKTFIASNGGMNLPNSAELVTPIDSPPASSALTHNLQNVDPSLKAYHQPTSSVAAISGSFKGTDAISARDKFGAVVNQ